MNEDFFTNVQGVQVVRQRFDGITYELEHDEARLTKQLKRTFDLIKDGEWRTLTEIHNQTGDPEQSVSARLRDLRKHKHGGYTVERRRRGTEARGIFEYRIIL